jgi:RES domain-containing protein
MRRTLPMTPRSHVPLAFEGTVWRYLPAWGHPLDVGYLLLAAGRWNRYGEYGCLYTALTREGAAAEYRKVVGRHAGLAERDDAKRDLVSLEVRVLPVLDLTDRAVRREWEVTLEALTGDSDGSLEACRSLADRARASGYRAILSPSAALRGAANLNIYLEGRAEQLQLQAGKTREPLNHR